MTDLYTTITRKSDGRELFVRGNVAGKVWGSWVDGLEGNQTAWMPDSEFAP